MLLTRAVSDLLLLAVTRTTIIKDTRMVSVGAHILQRGRITVVEVDADDFAAVTSGSALNIDIALALVVTVTARAIDFAVVFSIEVDDLRP